ncbi:type IV pili methyl-accepting chemotaxis transducer N-terminal domain-containing protein [Pleurocapsales cyanobacterium LEGE 06147]|nr:type IV pili methyl-accepting chemotaxis transducer N-terminal domain-containing protein [Pleurocapsales cyanobacterium LEGE 06147]
MRISTQLRGIAIGFSTVAVVNLVAVYLSSVGNDSRVVNYAGIVRGGTQRLVKLEMAGKKSDQLIAKLDGLVNGLIDGDKELGLPKATDKNFIAEMQKVQSAWGGLKSSIEKVRQDPSYRDELLSVSEAYFEATNDAVFAAENYSKAKVDLLKSIELIIFAIVLGILASIWIVNRKITRTLQYSASNIASSSSEIASTIEQQERTISQQATSVNETTTTMDELGASTRQAAEQAEASSQGTQQALTLAEDGSKVVHQTVQGMSTLKEQVRAIAEQIMHLSEQTGQIAGISELVGDIANQTNMLALNAAVEAARAGEQGKGFGVVASEIRKLADESKKSAQKINSLVTEIQAAMNSTVMVTDEGTKKTEESIALARGTAETFISVADAINNVFLNSQQISLSSKQQAIGVQQVIAAMNALNLGARETAAGIHQVKTSTQQLQEAAQKLKAMV